jgi:peptide/nickel transport system substrate-binding protein
MVQRPKVRTVLALATLSAFGLVAAACGGGGGGSSSGTTQGTSAPTVAGSEAPSGSTGASTGGGTEAPTTAAAAQPTSGGKVIWGIEADTSSPWRPAEMVCATSCYQVAGSVYDPLTVITDDGSWKPYLAESVLPNADNTVWTIKVRPGITFHDGTPLDGAAVVENLTRAKNGFLTGTALADVTTIAINPSDPLAADVTVKRPWTSFPLYLAGQIGMIASPTWLKASDNDDALKAKPVGTGPFIFESYAPNESFKAKRNPSYWNKPYPYLDEIEFRPIPDALNRRDALKSGAVDVIHTDNGQVITEFRDNKDFPQEEISNNAEVGYTLLHVTQVLPDGTKSPLQDQRVRCALANAWDQPTISQTIEQGVFPIADGPFAPGTPGYLKDNGFPQKQDMDKAKALIADYKKENPGPLNLSLATTQDETNLTIAQFQKQWWEEAGVDNVTLDQIDQANYIVTALLGNFQVFQWRNHSGFDLDNQYIWWHSSSAVPVGQLALNFGRIKDPQIDALLDKNRAETDPAKKQGYAEEVNKIFADQCYNLWGSWDIWGIAHKPTVHGVENFTLPDGKTSQFGQGIAGTFYPMTLWTGQ